MKKVYQRIIDPNKGDCFKCCIASLLELDYDEVPNFVEQEDWFGDAIDFCKEHGYDFAYREYFNPQSQLPRRSDPRLFQALESGRNLSPRQAWTRGGH